MGFMDAVASCFQNYATIRGRTPRSEYWFFGLFIFCGGLVVGIVDLLAGTSGLFLVLFILGILLPSFTVLIRRLHDIDRSGWWYFVSLIPLVGNIILLVWACTKGTDGPNQFGADPL